MFVHRALICIVESIAPTTTTDTVEMWTWWGICSAQLKSASGFHAFSGAGLASCASLEDAKEIRAD